MNAVSPGKWVEGVSAGSATRDVAVRTLRSRLAAVCRYLPLAADRAEEDVEHVHQLRVWSRRAAAALALYEEWLPRRRFRRLKKQLKRVRRAANEARDCDVLIRGLTKKEPRGGAKHWLEAVRAERAEAQKAIVAVHERLRRDRRFARQIGRLLQRVRPRGGGKAARRFGDWARRRLRPVVDRFFAAVPHDRADEAALHRFRIRGKELRYAMELLAAAFPESFRTRLCRAVETLQDRLGEVNDLATAAARLEKKIEAAGDAARAASWRRLLATERERFQQARRQFWAWCTPQWLRDLRDGFETVLAGPASLRAARVNRPLLTQ